MALISELINKIKTATYGKSVRSSIADGIDEINKEVESTTNRQQNLEANFEQLIINAGESNAEIVAGRHDNETGLTFTSLPKRLDASSAKLSNMELEKANKADVEIMLSAVLTGAPKGLYNTLSALKIAFPQGTSGYFLVLEDMCIYIWNQLGQWVNVAPYQGNVIVRKSVNQEHTTFLFTGKNLFNKDTVTPGYYIEGNSNNPTNLGKLIANSAYFASDFIPVNPNTSYSLTDIASSHYCFYDLNKIPISGDYDTGKTITSPSNAVYLRVSVALELYLKSAQLELGTATTSYESFRYKMAYLKVNSDQIESLDGSKINKATLPLSRVINFASGKNLFDKSTVVAGNYVNYQTGEIVPNTNYLASDYIEILNSVDYFASYGHQLAFYDDKKIFISGLDLTTNGTNGATFKTPSNARYVKVTIPNSYLEFYQLEIGTVKTTYESFKYKFQGLTINGSRIDDSSISLTKLTDVSFSRNLFNKATAVLGYYVDYQHGTVVSNASYYASDFIEVSPSTGYFLSYGHQVAFYNSSKVFISGLNLTTNGANGAAFTTPSNAKYIKVTVPKNSIDSYQLELGSIGTSYQSYGYSLPNLNVPIEKDEFLLFLPAEICIAVGRTIELYNKQVCWTGNVENYHFKWECSVGRSMKRKWTCLGESAKIGSYTLKCTVYDNNMKQVATASTTVKIVNAAIGTSKKVLPIGDSLTNGKGWLAEVRDLSGNQLSFVGTRWNADVKGGYLNHEGRSGASSSWYLNNSSYTFENNGEGSNNPFWNPTTSQFDFDYYKSTYNINPDIVQIFLGTNGIALDPTTNANNIKAIVDGIRASDPNIQVYIVFTLYRGDQNGIGNQLSSDGYSAGSGVWKLEEDRKVYNLMVKINDLLKSYSNLFFIPISLTHDSEYNFRGTTPAAVNPRSTITELQDAEATHPSSQSAGYLQMADIMFSTFAAHIV